MSEYTETLNNLQSMLDSLRIDNAVSSLARLSSGLFRSIYDVSIDNIRDFNLRNYQYMLYHMSRNLYEKNTTLASVSYGMNVYENGDGDNLATPAQNPSYTDGNNYMAFVKGERGATNSGQLTTRSDVRVEETPFFKVRNKYFDITENFKDNENTGSSGVEDSNDAWTDANSLLFKTKQLWKRNKIKSIISDFHTNDVKYVGQARTDFGESHGRNLLTKAAETNPGSSYDVNGYNNPYCRVWTHHHQYSKFKNGMRANSIGLTKWGSNFEWTDEEKTNSETRNMDYPNGENYDYAWRGQHNQERKIQNSVLDYSTGLVNITPKYMGGQERNIHTKKCMFSIENLAWRDYDPYSFEQALSWEQRGPLGGRIMWFQPYGLTVNETTSTNWSSNEFIGRGEKVYTYVNTERTGNLSFIMLTDHPSSVDYATWYEGSGDLNSETDFLRYFAGCNDGKTEDGEFISAGNTGREDSTLNGGMNNDMLIKRPPYLTDEYPHDERTTFIIPEEKKDVVQNVVPESQPEPTNVKVEFFIFYPNNYSGCYDAPCVNDSSVNAIAYLLAGNGAQRMFSGNKTPSKQIPLTKDLPITPENFDVNTAVGYEMGTGPGNGVTRNNTITNGSYMVGSGSTSSYVPSTIRYWQYRIDALKDKEDTFQVKVDNYKNCIIQSLYNPKGESGKSNNPNYKDTNGNSFNLTVSDKVRDKMATNKDSIYSFAEVAAAFYSEKVKNVPGMYNYLIGLNGINKENVDKLIELFGSENSTLISINVEGISNSHGYNNNTEVNRKRNESLSKYRAKTAINWLRTYDKWKDINAISNQSSGVDVGKAEKWNSNGENSKLYRSARVIMEFSMNQTVSENKSNQENIHKNFTHISSTETGGIPDFEHIGHVFELVNGDFYQPVNERPANWATNYSSYYTNIINLDAVTITPDDDANTTYKEYVGFRHVKQEIKDNGQIWDYYEKDNETLYFEEVVPDNKSEDGFEPVEQENGATVTEDQILALINYYRDGNAPYGNIFEFGNSTVEEDEKYRGVYSTIGGYLDKENKYHVYAKDDIVKIDDSGDYYSSEIDFAEVYEDLWWDESQWSVLTEEDFQTMGYSFLGVVNTDPTAIFIPQVPAGHSPYLEEQDLVYIGDDEHLMITTFSMEDNFSRVDNQYQKFDILESYMPGDIVVFVTDDKEGVYEFTQEYHGYDYFEEYYGEPSEIINFDIEGNYTDNDVVIYLGTKYDVYSGVDMSSMVRKKNTVYNPGIDYSIGDIVQRYGEHGVFWAANSDITAMDGTHFSEIINFDASVYNPDGNDQLFMGGYEYKSGDICRKLTTYGYHYHKAAEDYEWSVINVAFDDRSNANWRKMDKTETQVTTISWLATKLLDKASETLGYSTDTLLKDKIFNNPTAEVNYADPDADFNSVWQYGKFENVYGEKSGGQQRLTEETVLGPMAVNTVIDKPYKNDDNENVEIYSDEETRYVEALVTDKWGENVAFYNGILCYVSAYRMFDYIRYVKMQDGTTRDALNDSSNTYEDMKVKSEHSDGEQCSSTLWIDRGDGILVQECYLQQQQKGLDYSNERSKDLNKLRYDQEYHFYKKYMEEHPFVFEKLQEKLQYFEPAFHSMTPEGFNARLTFLQQCSRQGKTKTMSDEGGKTANNLAFGRPPFCVLRLGDFYNQMIVIDSISYDYSISDGLQWDLNPEGNGVQPMLAKININFKFIGGGDITGPVRRLQNAMTFNYYANTSFYDNRADRVEYQETNYKTMGGAGNNNVDTDKSYVYKAELYSDQQQNKYLRATGVAKK